jgi:hypothetical protein
VSDGIKDRRGKRQKMPLPFLLFWGLEFGGNILQLLPHFLDFVGNLAQFESGQLLFPAGFAEKFGQANQHDND